MPLLILSSRCGNKACAKGLGRQLADLLDTSPCSFASPDCSGFAFDSPNHHTPKISMREDTPDIFSQM
jgi:hypothetical protein